MLIGNGYRAGAGPHRLRGAAHLVSTNLLTGMYGGAWRNINAGDGISVSAGGKSGIPSGVSHPVTVIMPQRAGGLASIKECEASSTASAAITDGRNLATTIDGTSTASAILQLVVSGAGTSAGSSTVAGNIVAALAAVGTSAGTSTASAVIGAIADIIGTAAGSASCDAEPWGLGWMIGEVTPFTTLSPENLASAVWAALAAENNDTGSMGELLAAAGAAGDPLLGVVENGLTLRDVQRIVLSVLAGEVTGAGTGTETFKGQAGEDRVVSTVDDDGNRSSVVLDAA